MSPCGAGDGVVWGMKTLAVLATVPLSLSLMLTPGCPAADGLDDGAEGEGEGEAPADDFGFVFVTSDPLLGFSRAGAVFRRAQPRAFACTETDVAGCVVLACDDAPLAFVPTDAGDVDVSGALVPVALRFNADDGYNDVDATALFNGGEDLVAVGVGATVPAFTLQTTAPTAVSLTSPAWPSPSSSLSVVRADGLSLAWTGVSAGDVRATFNSADFAVEVSCAFPAAAGTGLVPAAALQALDAGDGFLDVEVRTQTTQRQGSWQLQLSASTHAVAGTEPAIAAVVLQ